ncbi:MAG: type II secretion system protein M [Pigmentiphaga sp.]|nr:type II secretion system protein M [Pigmentiphaga sp.]
MKLSRPFVLPAAPSWWLGLRRQWDRSWQRLAPRERRLVILAAAVAGLALVWLMLFEPAWQAVNRWRSALPQLSAQAAQLDAVLRETRELQRQAGRGQADASGMAGALEESLLRAGLADVATLSQPAADRWSVALEQAPVLPTLEWLQALPFELRLQAEGVSLQRSADADGRVLAGRLSGEIQLRLPAGAAP